MVTIDLTTLAANPRLSDPDVRDAYEQTSSEAVETALGAEKEAIEGHCAEQFEHRITSTTIKIAVRSAFDLIAAKRAHADELAAQKDVNDDLYNELANVKRTLADLGKSHADELAAQKDVNADLNDELAAQKDVNADLKDELAAQKTAFAAQKDVNADLYKRLTSLEQSLVSRTTLAVVDREIAHAFCDALGVTPLDRLTNVLKLSEAQNHCHLHIYRRINVALHQVRNKLNKIAHPTEVDPALIFDELAKVMKEVDLNFLKKRVQRGQGSNADGAVSTSNLRK